MCAVYQRDEKHARHVNVYMAVDRVFDRLLSGYTRGLDFVLRHQVPTILTFIATVVFAGLLYAFVPKGFFPQQDIGVISGLSDGPQDISFDKMVTLQHKLLDRVGKEPEVSGYGR